MTANMRRIGPKPTGMKPAEVIAVRRAMDERATTGTDSRPVSTGKRPAPKPTATQPDEFLRRARALDAAKHLTTPAGQRMAQRVHARALSAAIEQLVIAALPHVDDALTMPMVEVQLHTPGTDGELIASFQLPKEIADTVTVAIRYAGRGIADDNAEHSRTADPGPAAARPALSVLTGGVA